MGRNGEADAEEFDQFMEVQRHVRRMQTGTPMLLQLSGGADSGGQEEMQICTLWITQDLQTLKWREQEGNGSEHELPLNVIADIVEDNSGVDTEEESSYSFTIALRNGKGTSKKLPSALSLICVSREDLTAWCDGLQLLVGGASLSVAAATPGPAAASGSGCAKGSASTVETEGNSESLQQQLQKQKGANEKLQKENGLLKELVRRRDASIAALLRDVQSRSNGNAMERCTKTGASSRESDEHLSYREAAILRHKNQKLQKTLRAKQQTIAELLQLVGKVTQQQCAESSAMEELHGDDDSELTAEEEKEEQKEREEDDGAQERLVTIGRATRFQANGNLGRAMRGRGGSKTAGAAAAAAPSAAAHDAARDASSGAAAAQAKPTEDAISSDEEEIAEELAALAGRLELLESDMGMEEMQFAPPPRGPSVPAKVSAPVKSCPVAGNFDASEPVSNARNDGPAEKFLQVASGAGITSGLQRSTAALQALAREMELLEEKKRVVEQLARRLEPPSDGEEDDGFPLR